MTFTQRRGFGGCFGKKLDGVALLVPNAPCANFTT